VLQAREKTGCKNLVIIQLSDACHALANSDFFQMWGCWMWNIKVGIMKGKQCCICDLSIWILILRNSLRVFVKLVKVLFFSMIFSEFELLWRWFIKKEIQTLLIVLIFSYFRVDWESRDFMPLLVTNEDLDIAGYAIGTVCAVFKLKKVPQEVNKH